MVTERFSVFLVRLDRFTQKPFPIFAPAKAILLPLIPAVDDIFPCPRIKTQLTRH